MLHPSSHGIDACIYCIRLFYVALVTLLLLAAGGVLTGFFYPRSLGVTIVNLNSTNDTNLDIYWDLPLDNESYVAILEILVSIKHISPLNFTFLHSDNGEDQKF